MSIIDQTKLDPSLNFRTLQSTRSSPQYRKIYPANGGERTVTLVTNGGSQNRIFNIPAESVNMGESYLEYSYIVDSQAGANYAWVYKDVHGEFDSLMYRDTGSMSIVDVKNVYLYNQITNRLNFSDKDLEYNDDLNGLVCTNAPLSDVKSVRFDGNPCSLAFKEAQQMKCISVAATASSVQYKKVYLKDLLKDSYFGLAKNQILPIETYLEINFANNSGRIGFLSTSAVNPSTGGGVFVGNVTISNLVLNLCVEQNQELVKMLKAEVSKGYSIPIPWIKMHNLNITTSGGAGGFVYNLPLDNKQHGHKIKRIVYSPIYNANAWLVYDHKNIYGSTPKISNYQTELDNQKMSRDELQLVNNDDYMFHKRLLKGSLFYNQPIYNQNWIHVDSFDYGNFHHDEQSGGAIFTDGLTLDKPMTYTVNASVSLVSTAITNVACVCGLKTLAINSSSFIVA